MITLRPGDEIHFIAVLDQHGDTLQTIAMERPLVVDRYGGRLVKATVSVDLQVEMKGWAKG